MDKADLVVLLESDIEALTYFGTLNEQVRTQLSDNPQGIGSLGDLRARVSQITGN